ncbi:S41 family peptidase [Streptomyces achmelvichensis]
MRFGTGSGARRRTVVAAALLAVTAGMALPLTQAEASAGGAASGIWQVDGYGAVLSLDGGRLQEYQVTSVSCIKGASAARTGGGHGTARYLTPGGDVLTVRPQGRPGRAWMHIDGSPGDRGLRRIGALPAACRTAPPTGPVAVFDVLWQSFEENYPFFAAKGIDWDAVRERYRPRVHAGTTDSELFALFREMLTPLHDAHVGLAEGDTRWGSVRPGTVMPGEDLDAKVISHVEEHDLGGAKLRMFAGGRIGYAELPGNRGYLRISGFAGYSETNDFAANSAALERTLDAVLTPAHTARLRGLVIDLRINGGGSDALGLQLAGRLTDRPYYAYAKRARNDPADPARFTRPQPQYVQPAGAPRYTGPVAVLTGGSTISAGETFTQALMGRPGTTVRIGQHTQGVFSDVLPRTLPNGMTVLLPNEEFLTRTGRTFDGTGIPPHLTEPVFTDEEFARGRDSAFDRALAVLGRRD